MSQIYGLATVRTAAREMLKVIDKFSRRLKESLPEERRDRYEIAVGKIAEGCEELLALRFKGEDDQRSS